MNSTIDNSTSINILGVKLKKNLSWTDHILNIYKTASQKLGLLYKTRPYFTDSQLLKIYKSHIRSQVEYCSPVWDGGGFVALGLLDKIQNRAIRLIDNTNITDNIPSLKLRRDIASLSLFYRYYHHQSSDEIHSIVPPNTEPRRITRHTSAMHRFSVTPPPTPRTSSFKNSFIPKVVNLWNSLSSTMLSYLKRGATDTCFLWGHTLLYRELHFIIILSLPLL